MTPDEADSFVEMVTHAWSPELSETQQSLWRAFCLPLDAQTAFSVLMRQHRRALYRMKPPEFLSLYHRERADTTPLHTPQDRDEMPDWVRAWRLARSEGERRVFPEQEVGFRSLHEEWDESSGYSQQEKFKFRLKSGYEWDAILVERGILPQEDRLRYVEDAKLDGRPA